MKSDLVARALSAPEPKYALFCTSSDGRWVVSAKNLRCGRRAPRDLVGLWGSAPRVYSKAVCGTTVFGSPDGGERGAMAVPMAFQSALAGVLSPQS